ncbi:hypothetical protein CDAR_261171 [Caerostris darwini]|uniref:Uncharacterized protein n=1 Tax=Caerostris darwini TaxID=1538125 RepID=A0AAV4VLX4_9ARAC|nr:hypothetical protein CDAR_261171 [Caerostris darwini]
MFRKDSQEYGSLVFACLIGENQGNSHEVDLFVSFKRRQVEFFPVFVREPRRHAHLTVKLTLTRDVTPWPRPGDVFAIIDNRLSERRVETNDF